MSDITCPVCKGEGDIDGVRCTTCNGYGYIVVDDTIERRRAQYERELAQYGWARTRENFIRAMYFPGHPPTQWDEEAEQYLPDDLRIHPAPDVPLP